MPKSKTPPLKFKLPGGLKEGTFPRRFEFRRGRFVEVEKIKPRVKPNPNYR